MPYFNYHAKVLSLIKNGHCLYAKVTKKHNNISPALVLYFDNHSPMPIRDYKWQYYFCLLNDFNINIIFDL